MRKMSPCGKHKAMLSNKFVLHATQYYVFFAIHQCGTLGQKIKAGEYSDILDLCAYEDTRQQSLCAPLPPPPSSSLLVPSSPLLTPKASTILEDPVPCVRSGFFFSGLFPGSPVPHIWFGMQQKPLPNARCVRAGTRDTPQSVSESLNAHHGTAYTPWRINRCCPGLQGCLFAGRPGRDCG